jgi:hypothetical protein
MLANSSTSLSKRPEYTSNSMSNLMLRTDGFKKVVKGLTYKRGSTTNIAYKSNHNGAYTSMGKRNIAK